MEKEKFIESEIKKLINTGSNFDIEQLRSLNDSLNSILNKKDFYSAVNELLNEITDINNGFLYNEECVITGINSTIYMPDSIKISAIGGYNNEGEKITEDTLFDIASVTKLFSVLLVLKLVEKKIVNFDDKIKDYLPDFNINDSFTLEDILNMVGKLKSDGRLAPAQSQENKVKVLSNEEIKKNIQI